MIQLNGKNIALGKRFPDGTFAFPVPHSDTYGDAVIRWFYESEEENAALYYIVRHLQDDSNVSNISLVLPYCPNARFDRVHHAYEVFTLKYFADFINALRFDSVSVLDPHSNVTAALIDRCKVISPEPYIRMAIENMKNKYGEAPILFYPDEGAMKRYADMITAPYAFGIKRRCWETGQITGLDIVSESCVVGKNVLMVDDICCRGGTFIHSARALMEGGANSVSAFCSHCENAIFDNIQVLSEVSRIYTTSSIIHRFSHEKIKVFPLEI